MKNIFLSVSLILVFVFLVLASACFCPASAEEGNNILFHIKTDLGKDDAQICVAYNVIWTALAQGKQVSVLIDASAVNTYKKGWTGKDDLEGYKLPGSLRQEIARQLGLEVDKVPATYGAYLTLLHDKGAQFYINGGMLVVAGISEKFGDLSKISATFFKPAPLKEMLQLFENADMVMVY